MKKSTYISKVNYNHIDIYFAKNNLFNPEINNLKSMVILRSYYSKWTMKSIKSYLGLKSVDVQKILREYRKKIDSRN